MLINKEKIKLVYLLAASHSGSTLTAMLLGLHPEIYTVGELKMTSLGDPLKYHCSCKKKILECDFWQAIYREMKKKGYKIDITNSKTDFRAGASPYVARLLKPLYREFGFELIRDLLLHLSPAWRKNYPEIQKCNTALMTSIASITGAKCIVDSSKIALRLKFLLRNPNLDIKVIRLVRDGRGVALTYLDPGNFADASEPGLRGGGMGGYSPSTKQSMLEAASEWKRSNEEAECILERLDKSQWMQVHYEDLCQDPDGVLHNIYSFVGVDTKLKVPEFRSIEQHVIGNGMRLDRKKEIKLDDRWKSTLSNEELAVFDEVAGSLNRKHGYT